jgi:hypothetical protein
MLHVPLQSTLAGVMLAGALVCAGPALASDAGSGDAATRPLAPWLRGGLLQQAEHSPLLPSLRLDRAGTSMLDAGQTTTSDRSRYVLPVLLSLAVPGTGEISMGHWWNGLPLLAADVATWFAYAHYENEGQEMRDAFEAYADEHWHEGWYEVAGDSMPGWRQQMARYYDPASPDFVPNSREHWVPEPGGELGDGYCDCSPPYIPYEEDPQEYYENAGKYQHFFPGWDDWVAPATGPDIPDSPNRRTYVAMRIDSNESFDNANTMLGVAVVTRVVSALQSIWLVRREGRDDGLRFEPVTFGKGMGSGLRLLHRF